MAENKCIGMMTEICTFNLLRLQHYPIQYYIVYSDVKKYMRQQEVNLNSSSPIWFIGSRPK